MGSKDVLQQLITAVFILPVQMTLSEGHITLTITETQ